jgi:minor extracellular protease Epr
MRRASRLQTRRRRLAASASALVLSVLLAATPAPVPLSLDPTSVAGDAHADDGGDGGGGDGGSGGGDNSGSGEGGDDGGDNSGSGEGGDDGGEGGESGEGGENGEGGESGTNGEGNGSHQARQSDPERRAIANEIVVVDEPDDFDVGVAALGFAIIDRRELASLGFSVTRLRLPAGVSLDDGADRLREAFPGILIADNSLYAPSGQIALPTQGYGRDLVSWSPGALDCASGMRIGLIDTRVDPAAPGLAGLQIVAQRMLPADVPDAPAAHGTAIAEIIAGNGGDMPPLVATPSLYNAAIFEELADGSAGASAVALAEALDWLVGESVPLANISLAGAPNPLIEIAVDRASARGLLMVAAVGNDGPDGSTAWPAAHPAVVAVTAVGPDAGLYRVAARGPEVDFAAPGISIWSGGIDGAGRFDSGTSYAVPFVTAAGAAWLARGGTADADAFRAAFAQTSRDLGAPGRDPEFGEGLIELAGACTGDTAQ